MMYEQSVVQWLAYGVMVPAMIVRRYPAAPIHGISCRGHMLSGAAAKERTMSQKYQCDRCRWMGHYPRIGFTVPEFVKPGGLGSHPTYIGLCDKCAEALAEWMRRSKK
jgi:hypothetical protein